ncbi:MAG: DegT/DnrJ/EryC1/StrS family aminotransferase [Burkholderiaceae bacterium]|nr:DegT/DnrJ/EryC1/StrS family aminotransferase [Burkholderiaceae bacterium]
MTRSIPLFGIFRSAEMEAAVIEVIRSGQIASGGHVEAFRRGFGELVGNPNVVTTNDMSSAIQIALHVSGIGAGDEVLTAAYSCMSSNAPIATSGARAAWVDVDPATGVMDARDFERAITPRTRAALLYHLAGYPGPVREIAEICRQRGIVLIEDCDNALLATIDGAQVGSFGDFAIHSFYPNRQINATEGGAMVCKSPEHVARAIRLRRYGIDLTRFRDALGEIDPNCDIAEIGWAATLNNLCSAAGASQLASVAARVARTRDVAQALSARLAQLPQLALVRPMPGATPSYWALLTRVGKRDQVMAALKARGVQCSKLHHRTDSYSGFGAAPRELPGTSAFLASVLALPCGWWLNDDDIDYLVLTLKSVLEEVGCDAPARQ